MATVKKKPAPAKTRARSAPASRAPAKPQAKAKPAPAKKPATPSEAAAKPEVTAKSKRNDWEAVERDFRTGKFTLRELEKKHGPSYAEISRRSKREAWTKDLRDIIKQATNAAVLRETVTNAQQDVTETVLAAAETNKQVILAHRKDIAAAQQLCSAMFNELSQATVNPRKLQELMEILVGGDDMTEAQIADARAALSDLTKLPTRSLAFQRLSQSMVRLQTMQRVAFGLDEPEQPPPVDEVGDLSDDELDARINERLNRIESSRKG